MAAQKGGLPRWPNSRQHNKPLPNRANPAKSLSQLESAFRDFPREWPTFGRRLLASRIDHFKVCVRIHIHDRVRFAANVVEMMGTSGHQSESPALVSRR
ncbi:hypothetical protein MHPYR_500004 [uncultured Mycobacterium sp.]|uniref:Uncharacterized protein n=1 Tax=uncultured Mycobacterium sp. TaxID=171292 RepID=A0A1Y5PQ97_9MYCO|nr:hypothetical protein MHPYR_500004 [uncultured Mycobacterium sp.]